MNLRLGFSKQARLFTWYLVLSLLIVAGIGAGLATLAIGLSLTNLTDLVPWGLWITIDISAIALAAGAFSLCAVVYLLGLKRFEPVARTATFIGLISYSMAMLCLLLDIGRPDRFWHGFVFWNIHSVLWEVTMCVGLYFTVLMIEVLPIVADWSFLENKLPRLARLLKKAHHLAPVLAIFGLAFSLLHQSSLGATYGVIQSRPIWYRPGLAILFIYSAVIGGISLTLLASAVAARLSNRARVNEHLLERLAQVVGWMLLGYLYLRFWDAFAVNYTYQPGRTEGWAMLLNGRLSLNFWVWEILLGLLLPLVILLTPRLRRQSVWRGAALAFVVIGVVAYRWDTNMVGQLLFLTYLPGQTKVLYTSYLPSLVEIVAALGVIAYGLLAFTIGVRHLKIVNHPVTALTVVRQVEAERPTQVQPTPSTT